MNLRSLILSQYGDILSRVNEPTPVLNIPLSLLYEFHVSLANKICLRQLKQLEMSTTYHVTLQNESYLSLALQVAPILNNKYV
jgi:hypothetical protein